jgi:hypothetical protein
MGRCKNYNTVAPETRHKETKRKTHKTNNHFTIGKSILQSNMDEEAARLLSFLHDKKGTGCAQYVFCKVYFRCKCALFSILSHVLCTFLSR